jgi:hypothetical protein
MRIQAQVRWVALALVGGMFLAIVPPVEASVDTDCEPGTVCVTAGVEAVINCGTLDTPGETKFCAGSVALLLTAYSPTGLPGST